MIILFLLLIPLVSLSVIVMIIGPSYMYSAVFPGTNTIYTDSYNEQSFRSIKIGVNEKVVLTTIGEPFFKKCDEKNCTWQYSKQKNSTQNYLVRVVVFDKNSNTVSETRRQYWID